MVGDVRSTPPPRAEVRGRKGAPVGGARGTIRKPAGTGARPRARSERPRETLEFLRSYAGRYGVAPSRKEIADALGLKHRSTADMHLAALAKKGWIELRANQPRYIRLLHEEIPVVAAGAVAREAQTLAQERVIGTVPRAVAEQFEPAAEFLVQLEDESVGASGLLPGDRIAVCTTEQPRTGEIVVVRTAGEIAVRRVVAIDRRRIVLAREDAESARCGCLIEMEREAVRLEGVMVGALIGRRPGPDDVGDRGR